MWELFLRPGFLGRHSSCHHWCCNKWRCLVSRDVPRTLPHLQLMAQQVCSTWKAAHNREHLLNTARALKAGRCCCCWVQALFCSLNSCGQIIYFIVPFKSREEVILGLCIFPLMLSRAGWLHGLCFLNYEHLEKNPIALLLQRGGWVCSLSSANSQLCSSKGTATSTNGAWGSESPGNSDQTSSQTGSSRAVLAQDCILQPELLIRMQLSAKGALQLAGLGLAWLHSLDVPAGPHDLLYHIEPICTYK